MHDDALLRLYADTVHNRKCPQGISLLRSVYGFLLGRKIQVLAEIKLCCYKYTSSVCKQKQTMLPQTIILRQ